MADGGSEGGMMARAVFRASAAMPARVDKKTGALILEYAGLVRGVFTASLLVWIGLFLWILLNPQGFVVPPTPNQVDALIWCFAIIAVLNGVLLLELWLTRVEILPSQISMRSAWRGRRTLPWNEVDRITFSPACQWFVLRGFHGDKIRVAVMLRGISAFISILKEAFPADKLEEAAKGFAAVGKLLEEEE